MQGASWWTNFIQACLQSVWGRPHCLINQRTAMSNLTTLHCLQVKDTLHKLNFDWVSRILTEFPQGNYPKRSDNHQYLTCFTFFIIQHLLFQKYQFALSLSLSLSTRQTKYLQLYYFGSVLFLSSLLRTLAFTLMILSMWSSTILHWVWVPDTNKIQTHILIPFDSY